MKELLFKDFENLDGFVVDLTQEENVYEIHNDIFFFTTDNEYDVYIQNRTCEDLRCEIVNYYIINYDYVFCKAPNVYQIVEETLYIKEENKK